MTKKWNRTDYLAYQQRSGKTTAPVDKSKGFAVYHCGKQVYTNAAAGLCHSYIKQNALKGATVGYAK